MLYVLGNQHHYDEDEEVIQTDYWDDIWQKNDVTDGFKQEDLIATITSKIVSSDPTFKQTIHSFLLNWRDIFSQSLNAVPADLPPLVVEIDQGIFMTRRSQGPPRMMTSEKELHIKKFIEEGLRNNIIRPSHQAYYSQVHLVAKPLLEEVLPAVLPDLVTRAPMPGSALVGRGSPVLSLIHI